MYIYIYKYIDTYIHTQPNNKNLSHDVGPFPGVFLSPFGFPEDFLQLPVPKTPRQAAALPMILWTSTTALWPGTPEQKIGEVTQKRPNSAG